MLTVEGIKSWEKAGNWYINPDNGDRVILGDGVKLGDGVILGDGVKLGDSVKLGDRVILGDKVILGDWVTIKDRFLTIQDKFICHIYPEPDKVLIRIGCEVYPADQWIAHGDKLAGKHGETEWWESHGRAILELLIRETELLE